MYVILELMKCMYGKLLYRVLLVIGAVALSGIINCMHSQQPVNYKLKVIKEFPHSRDAYTQGLFFYNGELYESSGHYGRSYFKKVDLNTGRTLCRIDMDSKYFAEGSCVFGNYLYILTWQEHKCLIYDIKTLKYLGELWNPTEGWGLTTDGKHLIMSDGSAVLYNLDPMTFAVKSKVTVTLKGKPVNYINELEYINGEIWANIYGTDYIYIINPADGVVKGIVDCTNLLPRSLINMSTDVLNGIAYNPATKELYITGKNWPRMYKIELVKK